MDNDEFGLRLTKVGFGSGSVFTFQFQVGYQKAKMSSFALVFREFGDLKTSL